MDSVQGLKSLRVDNMVNFPKGASLQFGSRLRDLTMYNVDGSELMRDNPGLTSVTVSAIYAPSKAECLLHLSLVRDSVLDTPDAPVIEWNNPNLLSVSFSLNINVFDEYLMELVHHCPRLTSLTASGAITDEGLVEVAKCCPSLTRLHIGSLITDQSLRVLAANCSQLKYLAMPKCKEVTGVGVMAVLQQCTQLAQLRIRSCGEPLKDMLTIRPSLTYVQASDLTSVLSTIHSMEYLHMTDRTLNCHHFGRDRSASV